MTRNLVRAGLFGLAICLLVCIFGEVGSRLLQLDPASLITLDSCVGYKSIPNMHGLAAGPQGLIPVSINSAGFRDTEHSIEKPTGTYRVLLLGDSFTEALQVPMEDTFWREIQAKADAAHLPLEIITMGVSSWGTGQEILAYECYGKQYRPDLVVLDFNGDDLLDNYFRVDPFTPKFTLTGTTLSLDESYKQNIAGRLAARATIFPGSLYFIKDHSMFIRYLLLKIQNAHAGTQLATMAGSEDPTLPEYAQDQTPEWNNAWSITNALLVQLASDVHAEKSQLLVVNMPTLTQLTASEDTADSRYNLHTPDTKLSAITSQLHIPFLDLYDPLYAAQTTAAVHWPNDPHLTEYGHTIVAELLFNEVVYLRNK